MSAHQPFPSFSDAEWYSDPSDHRCPHDAWLESFEIYEPAEGERSEKRTTAIVVRLLGAYHDGHITFRYSDVTSYEIRTAKSERGIGDWIDDQFTLHSDGSIKHKINWCMGSNTRSTWLIEAASITYEWKTKKA